VLRITILGDELFDEENSTFFRPELGYLELEHSLVSLSKWESFWEKPFLGKDEKTDEEALWYVQAMIQGDYDPILLEHLSQENLEEVNDYIGKKMTATWFSDTEDTKKNSEIITAEIVYYWMIALGIEWECQYWHLNRLLTLIKVVNAKNQPEKKPGRPTADAMAERRRLNEQRRAQANSKG